MFDFNIKRTENFDTLFGGIARCMLDEGELVDTGHWQALPNVPQTKTIELHNSHFSMPIPATRGALASAVKPNLPWAEAHFQERVGGEPLNPGREYKNWPWYKGNVEQHQTESEEKFSHTYMERLWPRQAGDPKNREAVRVAGRPRMGNPLGRDEIVTKEHADHKGIRYRYGDLRDVINLLESEPTTRQAYIPMWFPEDTGAHHGERVPCTLGYHLMMRRQRLHCFYPMRSLDLLRYFRDDVYMAGRLVQWFLDQLSEHSERWEDVLPGTLTLFAPSLHVFEGDVPTLERKYK